MKLSSFVSVFTVELFAAKSNEIFVFSEEALTREDARQQCEDRLSQLVSFNRYTDFHRLKSFLKKNKIEEDIWIGISKESGAWSPNWTDDATVEGWISRSFNMKWLNGEPSTTDSCARLTKFRRTNNFRNSWKMDSTPCSEKLKFVCKRTDEYFENQEPLEEEGSKKLSEQEMKKFIREETDRLTNFMLGNGREKRGRIRVAVPTGGWG